MGLVTYVDCPDCQVKNFRLNNYFSCYGKKNPDGGGTSAEHFQTGEKRCGVCKAKNPEETKFCRGCGRRLGINHLKPSMYYLES